MGTNRNNIYRCAVVLLLCGSAAAARIPTFAGGTGEPNDPYQIATPEQLISIGSDPNLLDKHFVLTGEIDLDPNLPGGRVFAHAVIAPDTSPTEGFQGIAFTGSLCGGHHVIKNLTMRNDADFLDDDDYLGLFGVLGTTAVVKNLRIEAADVGERYGEYHGALAGWNEGRIASCSVQGRAFGGNYVGGLAGRNRGEIVDCHVSGDFVGGLDKVGGLLGGSDADAQVVKCLAACRVLVQNGVAGGLVGLNEGYVTGSRAIGSVLAVGIMHNLGGLVGGSYTSSTITNCSAACSISTLEGVSSTQMHGIGGLVGELVRGSIVNCYATGSLFGGDRSTSLGGLVGHSFSGSIANAYAVCRVSAGKDSKWLGGLVGKCEGTALKATFWDTEASQLSQSDGGQGLITQQMQNIQTYLSAGWDFVGENINGTHDLWLMPAEGYPELVVLFGPPCDESTW